MLFLIVLASLVSAIPTGKFAHITFNDTSIDVFGNMSFTKVGGSSFVNSNHGKAAVFDGSNDYFINDTTGSELFEGATAISWVFIVKFTSFATANRWLYDMGTGASHAMGLQFETTNTGDPRGFYSDNTSQKLFDQNQVGLDTDKWYCLASRWNTTGMVVDINASDTTRTVMMKEDISMSSLKRPLNGEEVLIGIGFDLAGFMSGEIDEAFLYFENLNTTMINSLCVNLTDGVSIPPPPDVTPPVISNFNCTTTASTFGFLGWRTDKTSECATDDTTPTMTLVTDENAACRISSSDQTYSAMGSSRDCTNVSNVFTCTIIVGDALSAGSQSIYAACNDSSSNTNQTGALAMFVDLIAPSFSNLSYSPLPGMRIISRFDEVTGTNATDDSGNNLHGEIVGAIYNTTNKIKGNSSLTFGGGKFINYGTTSQVQFNADQSYSVWAYASENTSSMGMFSTDENNRGFHFRIDGGKVNFEVRGLGTNANNTERAHAINEWEYWSGSWDQSTGKIRFYRNCVELGTGTRTGFTSSSCNMSVGRREAGTCAQNTLYFRGQLDVFIQWSEIRTQNEFCVDYLKAEQERTDNASNSIFGEDIIHRLIIIDDWNISSYIFSYDNGSGTFANDSSVFRFGIINVTTNSTKKINATRGEVVRYKWYVNDSFNKFNVSQTYNYTIGNSPPTFNESLKNISRIVGINLLYDINGSDVDNDILTYYDNTTLFNINDTTGLINDTPVASEYGKHHINITIGDGLVNVSQTFIYTIYNFTVILKSGITFSFIPSIGDEFMTNMTGQNSFISAFNITNPSGISMSVGIKLIGNYPEDLRTADTFFENKYSPKFNYSTFKNSSINKSITCLFVGNNGTSYDDDGNSLYVRFGTDRDKSFRVYDDFEVGSINTSLWNIDTGGGGSATESVGGMILSSTVTGSGNVNVIAISKQLDIRNNVSNNITMNITRSNAMDVNGNSDIQFSFVNAANSTVLIKQFECASTSACTTLGVQRERWGLESNTTSQKWRFLINGTFDSTIDVSSLGTGLLQLRFFTQANTGSGTTNAVLTIKQLNISVTHVTCPLTQVIKANYSNITLLDAYEQFRFAVMGSNTSINITLTLNDEFNSSVILLNYTGWKNYTINSSSFAVLDNITININGSQNISSIFLIDVLEFVDINISERIIFYVKNVSNFDIERSVLFGNLSHEILNFSINRSYLRNVSFTGGNVTMAFIQAEPNGTVLNFSIDVGNNGTADYFKINFSNQTTESKDRAFIDLSSGTNFSVINFSGLSGKVNVSFFMVEWINSSNTLQVNSSLKNITENFINQSMNLWMWASYWWPTLGFTFDLEIVEVLT